MKLTLAALKAGVGAVDWSDIITMAAWDETRECRAACDEAEEPGAVDILERAQKLAVDRCEEYFDVSLVERCGYLLTLAAASLVQERAEIIVSQVHAAERKAADEILYRMGEAEDIIAAALRDKCVVKSARYSNSVYLRYRNVSLRVSDHRQVSGGGWNEATGERMGDCDWQWVISAADSPLPTRANVRDAIAKILCENRG